MQNVKELTALLEAKKDFKLNMAIGLDGFVDEIIHLVDKRQDFQNFSRIRTIADYGARISGAAGLSTNVEMVTVQTKLGGNGPILSNALLEYGVDLTYIGALGKPAIHPVFAEMAAKCQAVHSLADPGHTDACEFEDGKIMMGKLTSLNDLTWDACKAQLGGAEGIAKIIADCHLFGMENWTMIPYMSDIWEGMIKEVFPLLPEKKAATPLSKGSVGGFNLPERWGVGQSPIGMEKPLSFFDLADPEKRTKEDIARAMGLISQFEGKFRTVLGLNEKEVYEIAAVLGVADNDSDLEKTVMATYEKLGIYCLVVHPVKSACCAIGGKYYYTEGPFCAKPKLTTGAGDNFNAGFCLGQALGLDPMASITLGVCTSGFYVRNAKSPTFQQVIDFAKSWGDGGIE